MVDPWKFNESMISEINICINKNRLSGLKLHADLLVLCSTLMNAMSAS